jgi:hypothetical protein
MARETSQLMISGSPQQIDSGKRNDSKILAMDETAFKF